MSPVNLNNHESWWNGPSWLLKDSNNWPKSSFVPTKEAESEERRQKCHVLTQKQTSKTEPDILKRYSSLTKLLRITAWCLKFKENSYGNPTSIPHLTPSDLNQALQRWISIVQEIFFKSELKSLKGHKVVDKSSPLKSLNPFINKDGLIRVGGRLSRSTLDYDTKHPYILPPESSLSALVIRDNHLRTHHGSIRETLSTVRQKFWIIGGRPVIKKEILR